MSAQLFSIEEALQGKYYSSQTISGIIRYAEKRDDVYYRNAQAYLVTIDPEGSIGYQYRTIAIEKDND